MGYDKKGVPLLEKLGVDIGYKTTHTKTITEADIELFAQGSGDCNPEKHLYQP